MKIKIYVKIPFYYKILFSFLNCERYCICTVDIIIKYNFYFHFSDFLSENFMHIHNFE